MAIASNPVFLGTVALEPNRWGTLDKRRDARACTADWLEAAEAADFDGLEVWERHLGAPADPGDTRTLLASRLPIAILNSYVSLDDAEPDARRSVADQAIEAKARAIKFNVGNQAGFQSAYAERIAEWLAMLPPAVGLLCECHRNFTIAEIPSVAASILNAAGPVDRLGAIVHTDESLDQLRERFDTYGERIRHVHVNFLLAGEGIAPPLSERRDELAIRIEFLREQGFAGSWTLEFVAGVNTHRDRPELLVRQAIEDLAVLRELLA